MPVYTIYYFMVKPLAIPVSQGSSGTTLDVTSATASTRQQVLQRYRTRLQEHFESCTSFLPNEDDAEADWTVQVQELAAMPDAPRRPDFNGVSIQPREPIVYLVSRETDLNPSNHLDRRPSLVMIDQLGEYAHAQGLSSSSLSQARSFIQGESAEQGRALFFSDHVPLMAEVFTRLTHMPYDATNWITILGNALANYSFHEIAHGKAECANRSSSTHWNAAISGSVHDVSGDGILQATTRITHTITEQDSRLMAQHMLCPMPFYQFDVPVGGQFQHHGQPEQLLTTSQFQQQQQPPPQQQDPLLDDLDGEFPEGL